MVMHSVWVLASLFCVLFLPDLSMHRNVSNYIQTTKVQFASPDFGADICLCTFLVCVARIQPAISIHVESV